MTKEVNFSKLLTFLIIGLFLFILLLGVFAQTILSGINTISTHPNMTS